MKKLISLSGPSDSGPPRRSIVGILLMLPIGLMIVLVLLFFVGFRGGYFPGELLIVFVFIFLGLFVVRSLYWSSRRKYWRERLRANEPLRILRQGYARGEITREQFTQMMRDLEKKP